MSSQLIEKCNCTFLHIFGTKSLPLWGFQNLQRDVSSAKMLKQIFQIIQITSFVLILQRLLFSCYSIYLSISYFVYSRKCIFSISLSVQERTTWRGRNVPKHRKQSDSSSFMLKSCDS